MKKLQCNTLIVDGKTNETLSGEVILICVKLYLILLKSGTQNIPCIIDSVQNEVSF